MRTIAATALFVLVAGAVPGQSTASTTAPAGAAQGPAASSPATPDPPAPPAPALAGAPIKFEIADIHPSPPRRFPFFDGAFLENGRYVLRQATIADLITTAYGLKDSSYLHGGPSWLEWDRWDVTGKIPPGTTEATAKQMLQSLLKDRFNLAVHSGDVPVPSYVLTVEKDKPSPSLKPAADSETSECKGEPRPPNPPPPGTIIPALLHCHNMTMEKFADLLPTFAGAYLQKPGVDKTGLKGAYDFDLRWTTRGDLLRAGTDGVTVFDALDKQLGLKLTLGTANQPGFIVDSVSEKPTPNAADLAKTLPPLPPPQFEVATVKPSAPDEKPGGRVAGDGVSLHAWPLKQAIYLAWDLNFNEDLEGAPKWLDSARIDIEAKVPVDDVSEPGTGQGRPSVPFEDLQEMLKSLLMDRYEIKTHIENLPKDAYTLVAVAPKMTRADPAERTECAEGPGPDGKDPRLTNAVMNMLVTCRNVSMAQAAELFPTFAAWYIRYPIVDKTGLTGGWDFTLNWSSGNYMPSFAGQGSLNGQNESASDPNGAVSFYEAVNKELGLKLVKEKRPQPVVIFDHIDEQPTPN
jgi:uncharacterized protein (TIGR03435 family)